MDRRGAADDGRQRGDTLCAGPAAVVRTADCVCRPQQRGLFYQMVPAIPQGEVRACSGGRAERNSLMIVIASAAKQSVRSQSQRGLLRCLLAMTRNIKGTPR